MKKSNLAFALVLLSGCGAQNTNSDQINLEPVNGQLDQSGVVVKSRSYFEFSTSDTPQVAFMNRIYQAFFVNTAFAATSSFPITVTNSASSTMTIDTSLFTIPTISNQVLDFGYVQLSALSDNNLKVCGTGGNKKCTTALIRIYTTGAGEGLYNTVDSYGAPIKAGQSSLINVGLTASNAAVVQTVSIPNSKNVMKLTDFTNPKYNLKVDFSDAGAGSYSTTMVVEYALAE